MPENWNVLLIFTALVVVGVLLAIVIIAAEGILAAGRLRAGFLRSLTIAIATLVVFWGSLALAATTGLTQPAELPKPGTPVAAKPTPAPGAPGAPAGKEAAVALIQAKGCGGCHKIPGVPGAVGTVGPDLAGIGSRPKIAGVLDNNPENLKRWLLNPPAVKPGTAMPNLGLTEEEAATIAAYLSQLK